MLSARSAARPLRQLLFTTSENVDNNVDVDDDDHYEATTDVDDDDDDETKDESEVDCDDDPFFVSACARGGCVGEYRQWVVSLGLCVTSHTVLCLWDRFSIGRRMVFWSGPGRALILESIDFFRSVGRSIFYSICPDRNYW